MSVCIVWWIAYIIENCLRFPLCCTVKVVCIATLTCNNTIAYWPLRPPFVFLQLLYWCSHRSTLLPISHLPPTIILRINPKPPTTNPFILWPIQQHSGGGDDNEATMGAIVGRSRCSVSLMDAPHLPAAEMQPLDLCSAWTPPCSIRVPPSSASRCDLWVDRPSPHADRKLPTVLRIQTPPSLHTLLPAAFITVLAFALRQVKRSHHPLFIAFFMPFHLLLLLFPACSQLFWMPTVVYAEEDLSAKFMVCRLLTWFWNFFFASLLMVFLCPLFALSRLVCARFSWRWIFYLCGDIGLAPCLLFRICGYLCALLVYSNTLCFNFMPRSCYWTLACHIYFVLCWFMNEGWTWETMPFLAINDKYYWKCDKK